METSRKEAKEQSRRKFAVPQALTRLKRWKKITLVLLVLVLVSQVPFAWRRAKLARLQAAIHQLKSQRVITQDDQAFTEYKGVSHVHSFLGGHTSGNFREIIAAANANRLDFVLMTEHTEQHINTAAMTLKGLYAGVLFLNGNEVSTNNTDRVLLIPGLEPAGDADGLSLETVVKQGRGKQGLTFVTYPQEFRTWETSFYDGVEVYNVYTNARSINPVVMFFDALWSYRRYPDLLFANFYARPDENLRRWDEAISRGKRPVAIAGNDAHANVGLSLNDSSGKTLLGLQLDPYERSFSLVRVHVLIPRDQAINSETLLAALGDGHCFIGFDIFSDTTGFRFTGASGTESKTQGDELRLEGEARLSVTVPLASRIVLLRDGKVIREQYGVTKQEFLVEERGAYRVEAYLPQLPHAVRDQPWIISNPIYVR